MCFGGGIINPSGFVTDKIFGADSTIAKILDPSAPIADALTGSDDQLANVIDPSRVEARQKKRDMAAIEDRDRRQSLLT